MQSTDRSGKWLPGLKQGLERQKQATHYQILGVDSSASGTEIRHAYFRLKNVYMSGNQALYSLINEDELSAMIMRFDEAYDVLQSTSQRRAYDRDIGIAGENEPLSLPSPPNPLSQRSAGANTVLSQRPAGATTPLKYQSAITSNYPPLVTGIPVSSPVTSASEKHVPADFSAMQSKLPRIRGVALAASNPEVRQVLDAMIGAVEVVDGKFMRALRDAVGVDEQEMQTNTKISLSFLESLENDRIADMPQVAYAKGFVKSYLRYLGINEGKDLIDAYFLKGSS
jgi:curved DNA-binding protein CbpA